MGTTRQDCLHLVQVLARRCSGVALGASPPVSPGGDGTVSVDSAVVTVDFRRMARLRLPDEVPPEGARVIAFARPRSEVLLHPSAAR